LGITQASLQALNAQRCNRYFLAEEDENDDGSEATDGSDSEVLEFNSSDNDEEAGDYIIE
jgi:hypothetical protein